MKNIKHIAVFCGSSVGDSDKYSNAAKELVKEIKAINATIIYGAGCTGLMGVVADEAIKQKVKIIGVVPKFFMDENVVHSNLNELIITQTMSERKNIIIEKADACIALPGGFGTFDEIFEVATNVQLCLNDIHVGFLNVNNYFDYLIKMIYVAAKEKFIKQEHIKIISAHENPKELINLLQNSNYKSPKNWIEKLIRENIF